MVDNTHTAGDGTARLDIGPVVQVGIVVRDAQAMAQVWTDRFNFAPPKIIDWPPDSSVAETATYHGRPGNFRMRLAFVETGPVQLEFIQPLEGHNIYADFLEERGEGLHHILFLVDNPQEVAQKLGVEVLQSGGSSLNPGAIWSYLDTESLLGCLIELKNA
jgi:hypothetical protein